jgi:hypothetical protein
MLLALAGCAPDPPEARTTFLRSVDLVEMTDHMTRSLARDEVIGRRTADDPSWVISLDRIENRTAQIVPDREKWLYVARLRARLARTDASARHHLLWVIPPERWPIVEREIGPAPPELRLRPTHVLTGTFHSLTRTSGAGRADHYHCGYQLVDLGDGRIVWEDGWETKRVVEGRTYD